MRLLISILLLASVYACFAQGTVSKGKVTFSSPEAQIMKQAPADKGLDAQPVHAQVVFTDPSAKKISVKSNKQASTKKAGVVFASPAKEIKTIKGRE